MSDAFPPSPATPIDITLEHSLYIGNTITSILFGVNIFAFFASVYCIAHRSSDYRKGQRFYVAYGAMLLVLVMLQVISGGLWGQYMWIDNRNFPGGPLAYYGATQNMWWSVMAFAGGAVANILGDGLLVYRCFIIWDSQWYIIALLVPIYLASSVLAIMTTVETALPNSSFAGTTHLIMPWVSLSVGLNIIVTSMICFRLLRMRALIKGALSPEMSGVYTGIAAILIESAAPFTIIGIGVVVTQARNTSVALAFAYIWGAFCSLSPQMIILRVSMGHGWLKETVKEVNTAIVFAEPAQRHAQSHQSRMTAHTMSTDSSPISPRMAANKSDVSVKMDMSTADVQVVSLV